MLRSSLFLLAMMFSMAPAATITIAPDGTGDFPTLAEGLAAAAAGDTVLALPGSYSEPGMTIPDGVTLIGSTGDRSDVLIELTGDIPDLSAPGHAFLRDFTLRSSHVGVRLYAGTVVDLENVTIEDCDARAFIQTEGSLGQVVARNCTFQRCLLGVGRAEYNLTDCAIVDNLRGIQVEGDCAFARCSFRENGSTEGGNGADDLVLRSCEFVENEFLLLFNQSCVMDSCTVTGGGSVRGKGTIDFRHSTFESTRFDFGYVSGARTGVVMDCAFRASAVSANTGDDMRFVDCTIEGSRLGSDVLTVIRTEADQALLTAWDLVVESCNLKDVNISTRDLLMTDTVLYPERGGFSFQQDPAVRLTSGEIRDCTIISLGEPALYYRNGPLLIENTLIEGVPTEEAAWITSESDDVSELTVRCCSLFPVDPDRPQLTRYLKDDAEGTSILSAAFCDHGFLSFDLAANSAGRPTTYCPDIGHTAFGTCDPFGIYVTTVPPNFEVYADGDTILGGGYVPVVPGEGLSVALPEHVEWDDPDGRWAFYNWSNGGSREHVAPITSYDETLRAVYQPEYFFTCRGWGPGEVICEEDGYYPTGTWLEIKAVPDTTDGVSFRVWHGEGAGSYSGRALSTRVTILDEPVSQVAYFQSFSDVEITTNPAELGVIIDDVLQETPFIAVWQLNNRHTIEGLPTVPLGQGSRLVFDRWSDGSNRRHSVLVAPGPISKSAEYLAQHSVDFEASRGGLVLNENIEFVNAGTEMQIEAVPEEGFVFDGWVGAGAGSYTGLDNPAVITVDGPILQTAEFVDPTLEAAAYDFTLSASDTDPFVHESAATGAIREIHLWMTCTTRGLGGVEGRVVSNDAVFAFLPAPGVLNGGTPTEFVLAVGGCPVGPESHFRLGSFLVLDHGTDLCLAPRTGSGVLGALDCDEEFPLLTENPYVIGFSSTGSEPCEGGTNGCFGTISVRLSQLRAEVGDRKVHVRWQTTAEVDHAGFRIYRSAGIDGPWDLISGEELFVGASPYDFADGDVRPDRRYFYEVGAVDSHGHEDRYGPVEITTPQWRQLVTALAPVRPNPFTREADIAFSLAAPGPAKLEIYDVTGRLVRRLVEGVRPAGEHVATWDGRDGSGRVVPAGVYFSRFEAGGVQQSRKIVRTGLR